MRKELRSGMLYFHRSRLHWDIRMKSKNTIPGDLQHCWDTGRCKRGSMFQEQFLKVLFWQLFLGAHAHYYQTCFKQQISCNWKRKQQVFLQSENIPKATFIVTSVCLKKSHLLFYIPFLVFSKMKCIQNQKRLRQLWSPGLSLHALVWADAHRCDVLGTASLAQTHTSIPRPVLFEYALTEIALLCKVSTGEISETWQPNQNA